METTAASLTPYERCLAAIEGRCPDRVPAYTPTICCDVASKILGREVNTGGPSLWYAEAKAWMAGEDAHAEFEQRYEQDLLALHRALEIETFRYGWRRDVRPTAQLDERTFLYGDPTGAHQVWRWDPEVQNFLRSVDTTPRRRPEDWPELARHALEEVRVKAEYARATAGEREAQLQRRLGHEMMVLAGGGGLSVGVDESSLMACALEPGAVGDLLDCQLEIALAQVEAIAARGIVVLLGGGDMADKNGPMYSPRMFRDLVLPRLKTLSARCKELGVHYVWRTDGKLWLVSDMIFAPSDNGAGVPGYGEVDYDASMQMDRIRQRYPDLVVWANVSADMLRRGSRGEVYEQSMRILEGSRGKGYLHGCSNAVLPGTPVENVWAMMKARDDFAVPFPSVSCGTCPERSDVRLGRP
jgi:uroporphyrinogen decarboxylase